MFPNSRTRSLFSRGDLRRATGGRLADLSAIEEFLQRLSCGVVMFSRLVRFAQKADPRVPVLGSRRRRLTSLHNRKNQSRGMDFVMVDDIRGANHLGSARLIITRI